LDALSIKNYDSLAKLVNLILELKSDDKLSYTNLLDCLGTVLYLTIDRPGIRPDDRERYSIQFLDLVDTTMLQYLEKVVSVNTMTLVKNEYMTAMLLKADYEQLKSLLGKGNVLLIPNERVLN
jgi:hypothetical protein